MDVGDFNHDGNLDGVVCNWDTGKLTIVYGDGSGGISADQKLDGGSRPQNVRVDDFNKDGYDDLVVSPALSPFLRVYFNNGNGTFTLLDLPATNGEGTGIVRVGDLNYDTYEDLLTVQMLSGQWYLTVFLWDTVNHTFNAAPVNTAIAPLSGVPNGLDIADFNSDGKGDAVVADFSLSKVSVYPGLGNGTFAVGSHVDLALSGNIPAIAVGNFQAKQAMDVDFFLHGAGTSPTPSTLFLDGTAPAGTTAKYKDSASVNFNGGNPWKEVGTWKAAPTLTAGTLATLADLDAWVGLKNSDDQGTRFDLRAEIRRNGNLVASGETYCIQGVTRNPASAHEILMNFGLFSPIAFNGATDELSLKMLTRIGTNGSGSFCGGHSNAVGLRMYFDSTDRSAGLKASFN